jgi:hypothetical protein
MCSPWGRKWEEGVASPPGSAESNRPKILALCPRSMGQGVNIFWPGFCSISCMLNGHQMGLMNVKRANKAAGFILRELVAIVSTILLLAFLAAPGMSIMKSAGKAARCMSNQKQLISAWQIYADENAGKLVQNFHGGGTVASANDPRNAPWTVGWMDWSTSADNTNINYLRNSKYARLAPYVRQARNVYKCPSDVYISSVQMARGWERRVRSYSMNLTMGEGNAVTGPWDPLYKQAGRLGDMIYPSPGETSVFLDEHPDSINDPGLYPPRQGSWIDIPGNLHRSAGTIAFADTHVESHSWKGSLRKVPVTRGGIQVAIVPGDPDRSWLSYHSQRKGPESF